MDQVDLDKGVTKTLDHNTSQPVEKPIQIVYTTVGGK